MTAATRAGWRKAFQWLVALGLFAAVWTLGSQAKQLPLVGAEAPELTLPIAAGLAPGDPLQVKLSDRRGEVVVLDFWASWCGACRRSTPILNKLQQEFAGDPVSFFAVNVEPIDRQRVQAAHLSFGTEFPSLHDRAGTAQRRYGVKMLPTVVVVAPDGLVTWAAAGVPGRSELRKAISQALN